MFQLFSTAKQDNKIADELNTMFCSFHRAYERDGAEFVFSIMRLDPLRPMLGEDEESLLFRPAIPPLTDFLFAVYKKGPSGAPFVMGTGDMKAFRGFSATVDMGSGACTAHTSAERGRSTGRSKALATILSQRLGWTYVEIPAAG